MSAIVQADQDASSGPSTISLTAGCTYSFSDVYQGTSSVTGPSGSVQLRDWYGPSALPAIAANITIDGNGATLSATQPTTPNATTTGTFDPDFRFFYVGADPTNSATQNYLSPGAGDLTLEDLTLNGGKAQGGAGSESGGGAGLGGAIFNQGTLNLDAVTMTSNTASGGSAGDSGFYTGGGGIGSAGAGDNSGPGGGFGPGVFGGPTTNASYGGVGFAGESGQSNGAGGGPDSGLGGAGGNGGISGCGSAAGGDGSGGSTTDSGLCAGAGNAGGLFGSGAEDFGGGGVGGGGGYYGGGGFGAGGGYLANGGFGGGGGGYYGNGGFGGGGHGVGSNANTGGAGAGMGGAIFNMQGTVTIINSTLEGNSALAGATSSGAGSAQAFGGALFNLNGTVTLDSSTVDANTAAQGGSGVYSLAYDSAANLPASLTSTNSVIYGDTSGDVQGNAPTSTVATTNMSTSSITETNANVIGSVTSSGTSTLSTSAHTTSADPGLGTLQNNGGPGMSTQLVSLSGSAAGAGANCQASDERGIPRPSQNCDVGATQIDPPTVSITTPATNATYDQGQTVLANYSCTDPSDNETPTCSGTVGSGAAMNTSTIGSHTFSVTSKSSDGLQTQQQVSYTVVAPPTVSITTPAANASYTQGQVADANYSCGDPNGPGISSCTGTVANGQPINTSTTGSQSFTVTATSSDGLTQAETVTYSVSAPSVVPAPTPPSSQPAPTAQASATPGSAGLTYQFSAAGSNGNGSAISSYNWSLEGQDIGPGSFITHTFSALGQTETIRLTVSDADGQSTSTTIQVTPKAVESVDRVTVNFSVDKAALSTADRLALDPLRGIFAQAQTVQVAGYCSYKEMSHNNALTHLSQDRAEAILEVLKAFKNTTAAKITTLSYAATHFIATNKTAAGRAANRRATITIRFLRPVS